MRASDNRYQVWYNMIRRCYREDAKHYESYGGRGISVCWEWLDPESGFECFIRDLGPRPDGFSLDRVDPDGDYHPSNCRWASPETQANNRTDNQFITNEQTGEVLSYAQWGRRLGGRANLIAERINRGWDPQRAITVPPRKYGG